MASLRPPIPQPMQRNIRRRCGFGCIFCGCPLYEYHHIVQFPEREEHIEEEITLLCDKHHKEATNGLLSKDQIVNQNKVPYNVNRKISSPYGLHFEGRECEILIGSNLFSGTLSDSNEYIMIPISVDDIDLIGFRIDRSGNLYLQANIFDENNIPCFTIIDNQLLYRTDAWDVVFEGNTLTVREAIRKIFFEIEFLPPNIIRIPRARLLCNGVEILIRKSHIFIVNSRWIIAKSVVHNVVIGLQVGRNLRQLPSALRPNKGAVSRYPLSTAEVKRIENKEIKRLEKILGDKLK